MLNRYFKTYIKNVHKKFGLFCFNRDVLTPRGITQYLLSGDSLGENSQINKSNKTLNTVSS